MDAVWLPLSYWVKRPESDINKAKHSEEKLQKLKIHQWFMLMEKKNRMFLCIQHSK